MGFLDKIRRNMPGSPRSIAKSMLRAYNLYLRANPNCEKEEARRFCVETRYKVIKILTQAEIEKYLSESPDLGSLVYTCMRKEHPPAFKYPFAMETLDDLCTFFRDNAPEEASILWELRREVHAKIRKKWGIPA
jgi:hypothetical protein